MRVEQAVFSSGRRKEREGFHLVGRSAGVTRQETSLLVRQLPWCDAPCPADRPSTAICYGALNDETIFISRTVQLAGGPVSQGLSEDASAQLLTHCFLVGNQLFQRFANNPFAILQAVGASGFVLSHESGARLQPIRLTEQPPAFDRVAVAGLAHHPGPAALAGLVHEALESERLILVGPRGEELLAGLMNLLPVDERRQFSFSVGLRPSMRRPARIVSVPRSSAALERFARQCRYEIVKTDELERVAFRGHAWAELIEQALEEADLNWLAERVETSRAAEQDAAVVAGEESTWSDEAWAAGGQETERAMRVRAHAGAGERSEDSSDNTTDSATDDSNVAVLDAPATAPTRSPARELSSRKKTAGTKKRPRARLHHDVAKDDPEALEMLERLDDLVYDAIAGRPGAFEELGSFWPEAQAQLEGEALVESREQYVRYALGLWSQDAASGIQDPERALGAVDVLCLLFPEGEF